MGKHVFVSYAHRDGEFAHDLIRRLRRARIAAWQDIQDLRGGDRWYERIDAALRDASALIVILSPVAARSRYVTYEWAFALGAKVKVIPVLYKPAKAHERLHGTQYLDFTREGRRPWVKLLQSLPGARQATPRKGSPVLRARFDMTNGKPSKVKGGEYVIWLWLERAASSITKVTYEAHDDSFPEPRWTEKNSEMRFETWMQSYGDVLVTASFHPKTAERTSVGVTLYNALRRTHGKSRDVAIRKALQEIKDN